MPLRRTAAGRTRAARALIALALVSACLGAALAYAASRPAEGKRGLAGNESVAGGGGSGGDSRGDQRRPPRPSFIEVPDAVSLAGAPQLRFHISPRAEAAAPGSPGAPAKPAPRRRFQCRLDGDEWTACSSPFRLAGPAPGQHEFAVRGLSLSRSGRPGPAVAYSWQQVEPKRFSIESEAGTLEELFPGFPAQVLPVVVRNPNPSAIEVTSLTAAIAADPPGCAAGSFELTPSSASPSAPLRVPAGASASLPSTGTSAPTISMRNLAVNQDACMGARVEIVFSGEAHG